MLIELKSSATDPMNSASRMLQRFKETIILKPNARIALQSALITTNAETYFDLVGVWKDAGSASNSEFITTGSNAFWKMKRTNIAVDEFWTPFTGNKWRVFKTNAPTTHTQKSDFLADMNASTKTISTNEGNYLMPVVAKLDKYYLKDHTKVPTNVFGNLDDDTIMVNLTNFPINSRNSQGNTDNHIATIPLLTDLNDTTKDKQFYEPYNPTNHSLDNENDLNLNFIEVELLNPDGTQRTDLIHPTQITLRITNEISSN